MAEVQAMVDDGADPLRLGRFIAAHAPERHALMARKTALYVLRSVHPPAARLGALLQAGATASVPVEEDGLWPELVDALSETWSSENSASGRRQMLHERDPRTRRLLVASIARYAGSSRGLSDLRNSERRALRAELLRVRPSMPDDERRDIDATVPKLVHDRKMLD